MEYSKLCSTASHSLCALYIHGKSEVCFQNIYLKRCIDGFYAFYGELVFNHSRRLTKLVWRYDAHICNLSAQRCVLAKSLFAIELLLSQIHRYTLSYVIKLKPRHGIDDDAKCIQARLVISGVHHNRAISVSAHWCGPQVVHI